MTRFRLRKMSRRARRRALSAVGVAGVALLAVGAWVRFRPVDFAPFDRSIAAAASESQVDPALIRAVIAVESKGDPDAVSAVGAQGLMQLMPATAGWTANRLRAGWTGPAVWDPATNIRLGTAYLRYCLDESDESAAWAAACYHGGPARVRRLREAAGSPADPVPVLERANMPNTAHYVRKVTAALAQQLGG